MSEQHNLDQTSSIGATWPPEPTTHSRLRGFYDQGVVCTPGEINVFRDQLQAYSAEILGDSSIDRLSIRAVTAIGAVGLLAEAGICVEAAIPFERDGERLAIVYTGLNHPRRSPSAAEMSAHRQLLHKTIDRGQNNLDPVAWLKQKDYSPHIINKDTPAGAKEDVADGFVDLYATFGYDSNEVRTLLNNRDKP